MNNGEAALFWNEKTNERLMYWVTPLILFLGVPSTFLAFALFKTGETYTCLFQFVYTLYLILSTLSKADYRNNPFIAGACFYFLYVSVGPLIVIFEIGTTYTSDTLLQRSGIDYRSMLIAQILLNMLGLVTLYIGLLVKNIVRVYLQTLVEHLLTYSRAYTYGCMLAIGVQVYLWGSGQVLLGGFDTKNGQTVLQSFSPLFFSCIPLIGGALLKRNPYQWAWLFMLLIQLLWLVFFGKFRLLLSLYLFSIFYFGPTSFFTRHTLSKVLILFVSFVVATNLYQLFHFYDINSALRNRSSSAAWQRFSTDFKLNKRYTQKQHVYFTYRFQTSLLPIARISYLTYQGKINPLKGEDLVGNLKNSTPSRFFYDKQGLLLDESLYEKRFGRIFPFPDMGNTIILQGLVDFGIWGVLGYIGFYYLLLGLLFVFGVQNTKLTVLKLLFFVLITQQIWSNIESTMGSTFVLARNFVFIALITRSGYYLFEMFTKKNNHF